MNYRKLFRENKVVRDLSFVQFISYFGAWFSNVAIYTMLVEFNSSALVISLATIMNFLPAILIGPISGAIIDKFPIKKLMLSLMFIDLLMTLCFLFITTKDQVWLLFIFIFIRMSASSIFFSSEMSLLAKLLKGEALQKANEIHSIIWSFCYAFGMAVSGFFVHYFGIKIAFIVDALFFLIAMLFFSKIDIVVKQTQINVKIVKVIKDGLIYMKNNKLLLHLIVIHASVGLTTFDTIVTLLAKNEYKYVIAVPLSIGISNAVRAVGLMIGPYLFSKFVNKKTLFYIFILQGMGIILWGALQFNFYYALIGLFVTGLFITIIWAYTYSLIQENCKEEYLGRVIAYNDMFFMFSSAITALFMGLMASVTSLDIITYIIGIGFFFFAFYYKKVSSWL